MDKYDHAIAYLKEHPEEINDAWGNPSSHEAGCLFNYCEQTYDQQIGNGWVGCLTQIRGENDQYCRSGFGEEHTKKIKKDKRIPNNAQAITVDNLKVFAEYQREMDNMRGEQNV